MKPPTKARATLSVLRPLGLLKLLLTLQACGSALQETVEPFEEEEPLVWMQAHVLDFLDEQRPAWRRERAERTLWRPDLSYSKKLLSHYAFGEASGWDVLPAYDFQVEAVRAESASRLDEIPFAGVSLLERALKREGVARPEALSQQAWLKLGGEVFWLLPMRRDAYVEWLVRRPELWQEHGLSVDERGDLRGIARYRDARGALRVGMTCALCHAADGVEGRANEALDLGRARAAFHAERGLDPEPFDQWGPGRVDVTDDQVLDPMAIPNLWGAKYQRYFNASGVIRVETPASAALRFETQYILNHGYEVRPPRALPWALAMWLYALPEPKSSKLIEVEAASRGESLFIAQCASCHDPKAGYSGRLVEAAVLPTSDPLAAMSSNRGTGSYRTPSLIGVSRGGPYLHDSSAPSLAALLERGHPFGSPLTESERDDLSSFLNTL